jgi:LuxR family transcriptional regulator, quorum-sensing system regulator BjaR1
MNAKKEIKLTEMANIYEEVSNSRGIYEIFKCLRKVSALFMFSHFCVINFNASPENPRRRLLLNTLPMDLINSTTLEDLFSSYPALAKTREQLKPIAWTLRDLKPHDKSGKTSMQLELLAAHDLEGGFIVPTFDQAGQRGVVCLCGKRPLLSKREQAQLHMICHFAFGHLEMEPASATDARLTERELECLRWTACGKTSAEVSIILGISEHTVSNHVNHVCRKLNAQNRPHMVAIAFKTGLLSCWFPS